MDITHLEELSAAVEKYKANKNSFNTAELQDIRDEIGLAMYSCAPLYADVIESVDLATYQKKKKYAEVEERLRYSKKENSVRRLTRDEIANLATVECEVEELYLISVNKVYRKLRLQIETATLISNSIASRMNHVNSKALPQ